MVKNRYKLRDAVGDKPKNLYLIDCDLHADKQSPQRVQVIPGFLF